MQRAVLFDLGNTLAAYYRSDEFMPILEQCVAGVLAELHDRGIAGPSFETAMDRARTENRESSDFRFKPMAGRLARIFDLQFPEQAGLADALCERFLGPIFAVGRVYDDVPAALDALRAGGFASAIVSNAPWGSPPALWRAELGRLGLAGRVDAVVMCGDVGWRKPARAIFDHAAAALGVPSGACIFVGDDLDWDVTGSRGAGMRPVLIERGNRVAGYDGERVGSLADLIDRILH